MPGFEEGWLVAMRALPAFPRALFRLHNFHDVAIAVMADGLATDMDSIALCLAEARCRIQANHWPRAVNRCNPGEAVSPVARLEWRLRREYRKWLAATMAESGYAGAIPWSDSWASIETDEEVAARFIVSALPTECRKAVARLHKPDVATVDLWRHALSWRRRLRGRLLRVADEIGRSGWAPFDVWIADRIAPDLFYPYGYATSTPRRRPLPEEMSVPSMPDMESGSKVPADLQRRFDGLPRLTQHAYVLHASYGRSVEEIAQRLGIGHRDARRRICRAIHIVCDWPIPSRIWRLRFATRGWRAGAQRQCRRIWATLRD